MWILIKIVHHIGRRDITILCSAGVLRGITYEVIAAPAHELLDWRHETRLLEDVKHGIRNALDGCAFVYRRGGPDRKRGIPGHRELPCSRYQGPTTGVHHSSTESAEPAFRSHRRPAAVDIDRGSIHIACPAGCEKDDRLGDLFGVGGTAERNGRDDG
jgi:hypothetical protein